MVSCLPGYKYSLAPQGYPACRNRVAISSLVERRVPRPRFDRAQGGALPLQVDQGTV
jgi:hypothetical protein